MGKGGKNSDAKSARKIPKNVYQAELFRLQTEFVRLQEWARVTGARIVIVFEGRDAAGKGGTIKRITEYLSPRVARIAALPAPTERERRFPAVSINRFRAAGKRSPTRQS
jgi:polyphosphate kinase